VERSGERKGKVVDGLRKEKNKSKYVDPVVIGVGVGVVAQLVLFKN